MSSAMASQSLCANVLRTTTRRARTAPARAQRMTVRAAAGDRTLPIDLRGTLRRFFDARRYVLLCPSRRDARDVAAVM